MDIYLPIAKMAVNVFVVLGLGGLVGFLSGLFGIGGGFLTTPLLIFIGIPPPVAVATGANQIAALRLGGPRALAPRQCRSEDGLACSRAALRSAAGVAFSRFP